MIFIGGLFLVVSLLAENIATIAISLFIMFVGVLSEK